MIPRFSRVYSLLCASLLTLFPQFGSAQASFNGRCQVTSVPFQVRAEGLTEHLGDINLQCSGANPGSALTGNLSLYFPVTVTNRVDLNYQTHDAVISVDSGSGLVPSPVPGTISGNNISFNGLNFPAPNGSLNLLISGIRGAASQLGLGGQQTIVASISSPVQLNQSQVIVGYTQVSLTATLYSSGITCSGSPAPSSLTLSDFFTTGTAFASTRLTEGYAVSFEPRQPGSDNGVRFLIKYSGFPANAHIYIPDAVAGSDALVPTAGGDLGVRQSVGQYIPGSNTLVLVRVNNADATGAGGFPVSPPQGTPPVSLNSASEVSLANGAGYAVYEVADANPSVQESAQFPTFITLPKVTATAVASETVSLAPVSSSIAASSTAPIVRFIGAPVPSDCKALGDCGASYFPKLMVDTTPIKISAIANGGPMTSAPGYIPIRNGGGGLLDWSIVISYQTGSGWLTVDYPSGVGNGSARVWADSKTLSAGSYQAIITVNGGSAGTQTIPITLTVTAPPPPPPPPPPPVTTPSVTISQVVNAATFTVTPLVPGSLATVMGSHFAGKNVSAAFDGTPAQLLYASDTQLNLQVPATLAGKTSANLTVTVDGNSSAPAMVTFSSAWPAIFQHGVLNQDNSQNSAALPAKSGDILQIFATGIPKGAIVSAQIGGLPDLVLLYAGEAPTVPGVQQVNVAVPAGTSAPATLVLCATVPGAAETCSSAYPFAVQ